MKKFTMEQNMSIKTKEQNQSEISEKSSDLTDTQDYEETDAVMESHPQRTTEILFKAVGQSSPPPVNEAVRDNFSGGIVKIRGTNQNERQNPEKIMKIKARGIVTKTCDCVTSPSIPCEQVLHFKITQLYPTTTAIDKDHLDTCKSSPIQISTVPTSNEQSKSSPGVTASITADETVSNLNSFDPTTNLSNGEYTTGYQPQLTGVNEASIYQTAENCQQLLSITEGTRSRATFLSGSMNSSRPSMDITTNESDSPLNARSEPKTEKVKIRVMRMSTKPTEKTRMPENLRIIRPPLTRVFASKDDLTEDVTLMGQGSQQER